MTILLNDVQRANQPYLKRLQQIVLEVMASGYFINGPHCEKLTQRLKDRYGFRHCILCNSGTDALLAAFQACGMSKDSIVYAPAYTYHTPVAAAMLTGYRDIHLVDTEAGRPLSPICYPSTDAEHIQVIVDLFGEANRGIVDLFGEVNREASPNMYNRFEIYDAAQSFGQKFPVANNVIVCLSFYPTKNLAGMGDGGAVLFQDNMLLEGMHSSLRQGVSKESKLICELVGCNSRLDELQAAVLNVKLDYVDEQITFRRKAATVYNIYLRKTCLTPEIRTEHLNGAAEHTFNQYVVKFDTEQARDRARSALLRQDIGCAIYYPQPINKQPFWYRFKGRTKATPRAEEWSARSLALPFFYGITEEEQRIVAACIVASQ